MPQMIFVNLPVADLDRARAFYEAIGFTTDPKFTNDRAACMVLSETIYVMLLTHDFWAGFTDRRRVDARTEAQVLLCISRDDRFRPRVSSRMAAWVRVASVKPKAVSRVAAACSLSWPSARAKASSRGRK